MQPANKHGAGRPHLRREPAGLFHAGRGGQFSRKGVTRRIPQRQVIIAVVIALRADQGCFARRPESP